METVPLDMEDIFDEQANEDDFPSVGPLPDLPDDDDDEVGGTQASEDAENSAEVLSRLKDLSKGAAKQVVRRPQPKLDATRLTGDRGIAVLPKVFQDVKFKGKGQEAHDLQIIMRYLEHWAHRLFPKMPFDEVLERIERLGTKNEVKTCIKKMRLDMPVLHEDFGLRSDEELGDIPNTNGNSSTAEIDLDADEAWEEMIREEEHNTQTKTGQGMNAKSQLATQLSLPLSQTPSTPSSHLQNGICPSPGLTPEQVERMERNKLQALARRAEKQSTFKTPAIPKSPARKVSSCTSSPHAKGPHGAAGVCSASQNQHAVSSPSSSSSLSLCTQSSPSGKVTSQGSSPHRGDQSQPTFLSLLTSQDTGTEDQGEVIPNVSASPQDNNRDRVTNHISSQINGTLNDSLVVKQCHTTNSSALEMSEVIPMIQKATNQNSSQVNSSTRSNVWPSEQDGVSSPKKVKGDLNLSSGSCDQVSEEELLLHLSESD